MKEQLVEFETAKLAKEKGFDIDYGVFYTKTYDNNFKLTSEYDDFYNEDKDYLAPTQSLLQKWLRDTQNIHVWVFPKFTEHHPYYYEGKPKGPNKKIYYEKSFYICAVQTPKNRRIEISSGVDSDWEDVLEEGLKQALKLC